MTGDPLSTYAYYGPAGPYMIGMGAACVLGVIIAAARSIANRPRGSRPPAPQRPNGDPK